MIKAHTPINWENEPSYNTPINETNLNKMDSTIGVLDDRIIEQDTSKLDKTTAYTMVKDISFNENNGIFTVTRLNGSTFTIDTRLEKIAINFKYDYSTQKLIVTLIDGTTQSIDMSSLITQYEFEDNNIISWEVTTDGKVKANILEGSITEDMLQPNYLAEIKVETEKSAQSMANAKISENNAKQSELNAKASEEQALEYSNNAQPLAQSVSGNNPTASNSTDGNIIYLNNKGYTQQDGTPSPDNPIRIGGLADKGYFDGDLLQGYRSSSGGAYAWDANYITNSNGIECKSGDVVKIKYEEVVETINLVFFDKDNVFISGSNKSNTSEYEETAPTNAKYVYFTVKNTGGINPSTAKHISVTINGMYAVRVKTINEEGTQYTTALIPVSAPLYEGDYIEVYADGSGQIVRENGVSDNLTFYSQNQNIMTLTKEARYYNPTNMTTEDYTPFYCDMGTWVRSTWGTDKAGICSNGEFVSLRVPIDIDASTLSPRIVYKLATPTTEPLTAEQVAEFMKLQTFKGVTHVNADGEVTVRYYFNNDNGETVSMISKQIETLDNKIDELSTYGEGRKCGTWIDGKPLYCKVFNMVLSANKIPYGFDYLLSGKADTYWIDVGNSFAVNNEGESKPLYLTGIDFGITDTEILPPSSITKDYTVTLCIKYTKKY